MADEKTEGGGQININSILALMVVLAGVFLVSNRLSSQRPKASPGRALQSIGVQTVDARLWEDPFGAFEKDPGQIGDTGRNFVRLAGEIARRMEGSPGSVHVIPALIPGGPYSEDRESRVRSRFAVVSALGVAGYAPEDAEHLGTASMPWPTTAELDAGTNGARDFTAAARTNGLVPPVAGIEENLSAPAAVSNGLQLRLVFEWFRLRTFAPVSSNAPSSVLMIWLDDDMVQDRPLDRMAMFGRALLGSAAPRLSVLGPRRSSTLRAMTNGVALRSDPSGSAARAVLSNMTFYSSTASVMDEVLASGVSNQPPRAAVRARLQALGVKDFVNIACSDALIASNAFAELSLRGIDLTDTNQHLVLVGEWDTFYGRMLSLTYAAELARLQSGISREDFVRGYRTRSLANPTNLHVFKYLRGLDGQSFGDSPEERPDGGARRKPMKDAAELAWWTPDENQAESRAQLDYLKRLGDQIAGLERDLENPRGRESIRAIGVVGSDIYDTMLILQALRQRFRGAVFFTTDLDARLWHPREFEWTRGLIVINGFGLSLADRYQNGTPPFRDGAQTAQYLAMLVALGVVPERDCNPGPMPRRFEIGRGRAVDLSVASAGAIHPPLRGERKPFVPGWLPPAVLLMAMIVALLLCQPLRDLLLGRSLTKLCWLQDEDLGDVDRLLARLRASQDSLAEWFIREFRNWERANGREILGEPEAGPGAAPDSNSDAGSVRGALLDFFNERIDLIWWAPADVLVKTRLLSEDRRRHFTGWRSWLRGLFHLAKNRREINQLFDRVEFGFGTETFKECGETMREKHIQDPLAQWLIRTAGMNGELSSEGICRVLNERLNAFPWAPREILRESRLLSESTKAGYGARIHLLRQLGILARPDAPSNRAEMDEMLDKLFGRKKGAVRSGGGDLPCETVSASSARKGSVRIFRITAYRIAAIVAGLAGLGSCAFALVSQAWVETNSMTSGEPFSLTSGISAWPTEFLRLIAIALTFCFLIDSYCSIRIGVYQVTRRFRLAIACDSGEWFLFFARWPFRKARTDAWWLWTKYQQMGGAWKRLRRVFLYAGLYMMFAWGLMLVEGIPSSPIRGAFLLTWDKVLLMASVLMFQILAFWTLDAARLCRWFIEHLSQAPTDYPEATIRYGQTRNGKIDRELLEEWIDTELIAELTERVGRLVYYPAIIALILLISRNRWWDAWPWPVALIVIFAFNMVIAISGVLILQRAADRARHRSIESLDTKLKLRRETIESKAQAAYHLGERLLEDVKNIRRGAFAPFWQNPVIGAVLVPSGGIALIEVLVRFWAQ